jgi:hypothetical protein
MGPTKAKANYRRMVLRLPDLDHSKSAVLKRSSITGLTPRPSIRDRTVHSLVLLGTSLAFNRIVVVRYRMHLEARGLAANTISQQLAAVRRLAYEAADTGLLSPELAAGIGRVNGMKQLGFRSGTG